MTSLDAFQQTLSRALTALAIVHVPILVMIAWTLNRGIWPIAAIALAAAPLMAMVLRRSLKVIALALAVTLVGQTSLLVHAFSGHPWQNEIHLLRFLLVRP